MARKEEQNERYEDEYEDGEHEDEFEEEEEGSALPGWLGDAPWWAVSALLHVIILLLLGGYVLTTNAGKEKKSDAAIMKRHYEPEPYDPTKKRDMHKKVSTLRDTDKKLIKKLKPDEITPDIPKGTSFDNLSNKDLNHTGPVDAFGMGGGAAGAYGHRLGRGSLTSEGGGPGTEEAVRAALEWLRRHQRDDGSWSCKDFHEQCDKDKGKCKNLKKNPDYLGTNGSGWEEHDIGVTALAMLAFTGYGHTHQFGEYPEYVEVLKKATRYMKSVQIKGMNDPNYDGCFRLRSTIPKDKSKESIEDEKQQWMYGHSIATMAVAELLVLSGDTLGLRSTVENAAMFCVRSQNDGWGWRYSVKSGDNDTSVSGWMVLALKTAKSSLILGYISKPSKSELERSFKGALKWFDHATSDTTGITGYKSPGDQGSRLPDLDELQGGYPYSKKQSCMTAVSVLCRLFAGESRSNDVIKRGVNVLMKQLPEWRLAKGKNLSTINIYYWYYGTFAMFQFGGGSWLRWNDAMQKSLLGTQRMVADSKETGGCEDGSWDPIGEWGSAGGRAYTTAMGALTLEVYYRYERAQEGEGY